MFAGNDVKVVRPRCPDAAATCVERRGVWWLMLGSSIAPVWASLFVVAFVICNAGSTKECFRRRAAGCRWRNSMVPTAERCVVV